LNNIEKISLKSLVLDNKIYLLLGLFTLFINKAAMMYIPSRGKYLIDEVIIKSDTLLLKNIILTIVLSLIIQAVSAFILTHIMGIKAQKKIVEIRTAFFNKLTYLPLSYFKNTSSGEITSRVLTDFESIRILLGSGLVEFLGGILSISIAFILMAILNLKLTLIILIPIVVFGIFMFFIYKSHKKAFKHRKATIGNVSANLTEAFRGIKIIKGFTSNEYTTRIIEKDLQLLFYSIKKALLSTNLIKSIGIIFIGLISIIIMWKGSLMTINKELTIGELTTFTLYLGFIVSPILQLTRISSQFTDANASIDRINETLSLENEKNNSARPLIELKGEIDFENVTFKFEDILILNNISFNVKPKTITAIVGKSGAGKTTLIDLIGGFFQPCLGKILIDNTDLAELNLDNYRKQLAFVFQETYLFNGSVKDNILLSKPNASETEIKTAIDNANVSEFLGLLPKGINSIVGENGSRLSEGQKQRIAIARAFLVNPKILILDEATSNLDSTTEKLITESINKLMENRTIIIVAHRLNTIKNADQIIVLDKGKLVEKGTHADLLEKKEFYSALYNSFKEN
jgi:subfamily B ATP-binding cassette protein MsbA